MLLPVHPAYIKHFYLFLLLKICYCQSELVLLPLYKQIFRDYRGGGRSSGRETTARVAAGAVAAKALEELGIEIFAYTNV